MKGSRKIIPILAVLFLASLATLPLFRPIEPRTQGGAALPTSLQHDRHVQPPAPGPWEIGAALALVIEIAAIWKVFVKAGQPGWVAIIPVFNLVVLLKIAGRSLSWLILLAGSMGSIFIILFLDPKSFFGVLAFGIAILFLFPIVPFFMFSLLLGPSFEILYYSPLTPPLYGGSGFVLPAIFTFLSLLAFGVAILFLVPISIAKCFGKGVWFGLGLGFLGFIFFPILAWGDAQYRLQPIPSRRTG